jgi:hypothetical protein
MTVAAAPSKALTALQKYYQKQPPKSLHTGVGAIAAFWIKHPSNKKTKRPGGS